MAHLRSRYKGSFLSAFGIADGILHSSVLWGRLTGKQETESAIQVDEQKYGGGQSGTSSSPSKQSYLTICFIQATKMQTTVCPLLSFR